jgi:hypothetical protein
MLPNLLIAGSVFFLEKLMAAHLVKIFPEIHGTQVHFSLHKIPTLDLPSMK